MQTPSEVGPQEEEDGHGGDLESKTGNHDIGASGPAGLRVSDGRHGAANCLQNEGDDIERDEEKGVSPRRNSRCPARCGDDVAAEDEVDAAGEESRCYGEWNEVPETQSAHVTNHRACKKTYMRKLLRGKGLLCMIRRPA